MTREEAKNKLRIIEAFAGGEHVQYRNGEKCPWEDCEFPSFDAPEIHYRIKPKTVEITREKLAEAWDYAVATAGWSDSKESVGFLELARKLGLEAK